MKCRFWDLYLVSLAQLQLHEETLVREERLGSEPGGAHFLQVSLQSLTAIHSQSAFTLLVVSYRYITFHLLLYRIAYVHLRYRSYICIQQLIQQSYVYDVSNIMMSCISQQQVHSICITRNGYFRPTISLQNRLSCTSTPSNHTAQQQSRLPLFYSWDD